MFHATIYVFVLRFHRPRALPAASPSSRVCGFIYTLISIDRGIRARLNYQTNSPMHVHRDAVRDRSPIKAVRQFASRVI